MPGVRHVSNTNRYRRPEGETEAEFTAALLEELRDVIEQEGPESVAGVFMEPVRDWAAPSLRPRATSRACARSVTNGCCWWPTR